MAQMVDRAQLRQWLAWNVRERIFHDSFMKSLAIPSGSRLLCTHSEPGWGKCYHAFLLGFRFRWCKPVHALLCVVMANLSPQCHTSKEGWFEIIARGTVSLRCMPVTLRKIVLYSELRLRKISSYLSFPIFLETLWNATFTGRGWPWKINCISL